MILNSVTGDTLGRLDMSGISGGIFDFKYAAFYINIQLGYSLCLSIVLKWRTVGEPYLPLGPVL